MKVDKNINEIDQGEIQHFRIQLFSIKSLNGIVDIGFLNSRNDIIFNFLYIFGARFDNEKMVITLDYKIQYTQEFQTRLKEFINQYKGEEPRIQQLSKKFEVLEENEWFFILKDIELTTIQRYELEKELCKLNNCDSVVNDDKIMKIFDCSLENYEIKTFDLDKGREIKIGENFKNNRTCRFCNKSVPDTTFSNKAHAISEALGNKKLILNDECDKCNDFFDKKVERDFIYCHDLPRTFFGVKNKKNEIPKIKGRNFNIEKGEKDLKISILDSSVVYNQEGIPSIATLDSRQSIKPQNIYKALCKFALSVIEVKYLPYFSNTIKWLKDEVKIDKLPKVALVRSNLSTSQPTIALFIRKNDNKKLPFLVSIFTFTMYSYIFIVPSFNQDINNSFLNTSEYQEFLNCFKFIQKNAEYIDLSNNNEMDLKFSLVFEQNQNIKHMK